MSRTSLRDASTCTVEVELLQLCSPGTFCSVDQDYARGLPVVLPFSLVSEFTVDLIAVLVRSSYVSSASARRRNGNVLVDLFGFGLPGSVDEAGAAIERLAKVLNGRPGGSNGRGNGCTSCPNCEHVGLDFARCIHIVDISIR